MGPFVEGMWDEPLPSPMTTEETALDKQLASLCSTSGNRAADFYSSVRTILMWHAASEMRKKLLMSLHKKMYKERVEGGFGYGGHLPNQVKNHPKLRVAIWNLFAREFGTNTHMGEIFRPKSGDEVRPNFGSEDFRHPPPKPLRRYSRA